MPDDPFSQRIGEIRGLINPMRRFSDSTCSTSPELNATRARLGEDAARLLQNLQHLVAGNVPQEILPELIHICEELEMVARTKFSTVADKALKIATRLQSRIATASHR